MKIFTLNIGRNQNDFTTNTLTLKKFSNSFLFAMFFMLMTSITAYADSGIFQTYAIINSGSGNQFYAGGLNPDGASLTFNNTNLGSYCPGGTLILNGGEAKTYKNGISDVFGANIYYRIYSTSGSAGSFNQIPLLFNANLNTSGDQKWQTSAHNVNLLSGLTAGTYYLEVYWDANTSDGTKFDTNFGNNFKATFTVLPPALSSVVNNATCNGGNNGAINLSVSCTPTAAPITQTYTQNFNTLATSGNANSWADNSTITNWYTNRSVYLASNGSSNAGGLYSFGTGTTTERALGSIGSSSVSSILGAVKITNTTGQTVNSITVSYTGEQWRNGGNNAASKLDFTYAINATDEALGTYIDVNTLDFISPVIGATAAALDGNASANRTVITGTFAVSIPAGSSIWLRWQDVDDSGNDHGLAIDDLTATLSAPATGVSYAWSNGATTEDISGLTAGDYTVTVSGSNGSSTATYNVAQPAVIDVTESHTAILCNGGTSTVTISATGGSGNLSGTGNFSQSVGTKSYTVTDANGCTKSISVTITEPALLALSENHTVVACKGGTSTVTIGATGGTAPYTGTGDFTQSAGTQSYIVTDANGCVKSISVTVTEPALLVATETHTLILCKGGSSTVTISAIGGTTPYTGTGNFPQSVGTQSYTVTDANGCSSTISVEVTEPLLLEVSTTQTDVSCYGGNNGAIDLSVSGGTSFNTGGTVNYTQNFNTLASTGTSNTMPAGWFFIESGSNANNTYTAGTGSGTAGETYSFGTTSDRALGTLRSGSLVSTIGAGSTFINNTGATVTSLSIQYTGEQWRLGTNTSGRLADKLDFQYSTNATSISNGTWTDVDALDFSSPVVSGTVGPLDGNAAANRTTISNTISGLSIPNNATFWIRWNDTDVSGADDGLGIDDFSMTMNSTTTPYTYLWSNGVTTQDISTLAAGDYTVTVKDANNCSATKSVTITQPEALIASATITQALCHGEPASVVVSATGGTGDYTGIGTFSLADGTSATYTVSDANSCSATSNSVTATSPSQLVATATITQALCHGDAASVVVSAIGGTGAYTGIGTFSLADGASATYTVSDANSCSAISNSVTATSPSQVVASAVVTQPKCYGETGTVVVSATGGTGSYGSTVGTFTVAAGDSYSYTVTDSNNCTSNTVSGTIDAPTAVVALAVVTQPKCYGESGTVVVSATGGTGSYSGTGSFTLGAGASYSYTVTDSNSCTSNTVSGIIDTPTAVLASAIVTQPKCYGESGTVVVSAIGGTGSYGATVGSFTVAAGASYSYTVTDSNSCTSNTVSGTIDAPTAVVASSSATAILCNSGTASVTVSATGGTAPYTGTGTFSHASGNYSYTVTDANGCTSTTTGTISQPSALVASSSKGTISCNGGTTTVTVSATGGTAPYSGTGTFTVSAGNYSYTVTDANGCTSTTSGTITQPNTLSATASSNNLILYYGYAGDQTALITASVTGGTAPYTITATLSRPLNCNVVTTAGDELWVPGAGTIAASNINTVCPSTGAGLIPSSTGNGASYSVSVTLMADAIITFNITDANGCKATVSQSIKAEDVRCFAGNSTNTKITICHKTGSTKNPCVAICVDYSALQEHLDHGDYVGTCTKTCVAPTNAKHIEVEEAAVFKVTAYPNPSRSQFTLLVEGNKNEKVEVIVYDMMARMIKRIEKSDGQPILFGEELPAGEYLTIVKQGENMKAVNVIKQ